MIRTLRLGIIQAAFGNDMMANLANIESLIRAATADSAQVILTPELFQGPYFCKTKDTRHFAKAYPYRDHPVLTSLAPLAKELGVVLPLSIFERSGDAYFNSLAMIDADGELLGIYRKSHIPDGPGYKEKFYFQPGDTGFKVWNTKFGRLGVGICWDQWFPEAARAMMLMGAEILLYPTAIGSEPEHPSLDTSARWRRAMVGHCVSNVVPVAAANRIGNEDEQLFYGSSFIADDAGEYLADMSRIEEGYACANLNLDEITARRNDWGFFPDRRPDLYGILSEKP